MRITDVNITQELITNGMKPFQMHKLEEIVLLAGKNGSGKTRILNLIEHIIKVKPTKKDVEEAQNGILTHQGRVNRLQEDVQDLKNSLESNPTYTPLKADTIRERIEVLQSEISKEKSIISRMNDIINWGVIQTDVLANCYDIVHFVPKKLDIQDHSNFTKKSILHIADKVRIIGVHELHESTYAKIQLTQDAWFSATHPYSTLSKEEKTEIIEEYEILNELLELFLYTTLDRNSNGDATIFGFPIAEANLSDGQKVLIQLCLAIHSQQHSLENLILFLDEPENHLHPSIIIEVIEKVRSKVPNGQIWIATHSLSVLSHFSSASIWYVDSCSVSHAGKIPEVVLSGLLGNEKQIERLKDFISLPSIYALNNHALECLLSPSVVTTNADDPQTLQINAEIRRHLSDDKIRVLDYGAGKGRLLANIIENNSEPKEVFSGWFDYVAYDPFPTFKSDCISSIKKIYDDPSSRYFNEINSLYANYDKESFDVIVMCNVLHEIDPSKWLTLFKHGGEISNLLRKNGILLLVENQEMLIGEKAYNKGFIVLDTQEIKTLFNINETDSDFGFSDAKGDGRLKAHFIKKEYLTRISAQSRIESLIMLYNRSLERIQNIRNSHSTDYITGKKHGFWVQQLANVILALNELDVVEISSTHKQNSYPQGQPN